MTAYTRYKKNTKQSIAAEYKCSAISEKSQNYVQLIKEERRKIKYHSSSNRRPFTMRELFWEEWVDFILETVDISESDDKEILAFQDERAAEQRQLDEAWEQVKKKRLRPDKYTDLEETIRPRINRLDEQLEQLRDRKEAIKSVRKYTVLDFEEKRIVLDAVIKSIRVYENYVLLTFYDLSKDTNVDTSLLPTSISDDNTLYFPLMKRRHKENYTPNAFNCLTPQDISKKWPALTTIKKGKQTYLTFDWSEFD